MQYWTIPGHGMLVRESADEPWQPYVSQEKKEKPTMPNYEKRYRSACKKLVEMRQQLKQRRKMSEGQDLAVDLTDAEWDELFDELKQFCLRGRGEDGKRLSRREAMDQFGRLLDAAHEEPEDAEATTEGALAILHGSGLPGRGARGGLSNEAFLEQLQSGPAGGAPVINPHGGSWPQSY
jgi:hypothetical protein